MVAPYRQTRKELRCRRVAVLINTGGAIIDRLEREAKLAAKRKREERIANAIAWVIVFVTLPLIAAYWVLWGRGKRRS